MKNNSKNSFKIVDQDIFIMKEGWPFVALTTYREDYYEELISKTWSLTKPNSDTDDSGYLKNKSLGFLHRYIVSKWYGKEVLYDMTKKGYVVDHMNNNHIDCRISNLEFLKKAYNTAKGQTFDVDSRKIHNRIAVNIFKDMKTENYQITIGCNESIAGHTKNGEEFHVGAIMLLYNCDYSIVINDAENIIRQYETQGIIDVSRTHSCDIKVRKTEQLVLSEKEKRSVLFVRNGTLYMIPGTGKAFLNSVHHVEGWQTPETGD